MQRFRHLVFALIVTCGLFVAAPPTVTYACSCIPPDPARQLENSSAVFAGKVVSLTKSQPVERGSFVFDRHFPFIHRQDPLDFMPMPEVQVRFAVTNVWKGTNRQHLTVNTNGNSAACGYEFQEGESYLVYGGETKVGLSTGSCSGTTTLAEAQADLAVLGVGQPVTTNLDDEPLTADTTSPWAVGGLVVAGVAVLGGLAMVARRRKAT